MGPEYESVARTHLFCFFSNQDYTSLNYLNIVVEATLSLSNSPQNIVLKPEKPSTEVKTKYYNYCFHSSCYLWTVTHHILQPALYNIITCLFCLRVWMTFHLWSCCPQIKVTVFLERKIEYIVRVAWWIIFLTVVALLLMLAILVFFIWKVNKKFVCALWEPLGVLCGGVMDDATANPRLSVLQVVLSSFIWLFFCHFPSAWMHQLPGSAQEAPAWCWWKCSDQSSDRRTVPNLPRTWVQLLVQGCFEAF